VADPVEARVKSGFGAVPVTTVMSWGEEVLGAKFVLPLKSAVNVCDPWVREVTVRTASPEGERGAVKRVLAPSRSVTEPVGVPLVVVTTWAVRVMEEVGLSEEFVSVMSVGARVMLVVMTGLRAER
jgi:hypothetical protein